MVSRSDHGGQVHRPGSRAGTQRDSNSVGFLPDSGSKESQLSIEPLELGASLLVLFVLLSPVAIIGGLFVAHLAYLAFAPELAQY